MAYASEVKASVIRVAGDIVVEYLRQYPEGVGKGEDVPWQLDNVLKCFGQAYRGLIEIIPADFKYS